MWRPRIGVLAFSAIMALACGDSNDDEQGGALSGGSGGSAGSGGAAGSGGIGGTGGGIVLAGMGGLGAFAGYMTVNPPATVDLRACAIVKDAGTSQAFSDCLMCCWDLNLENGAFFDGTCACSLPVDGRGATVCATVTMPEACFACCSAENYSAAAAGDTCVCRERSDASICTSANTDPNPYNACAVCCVNAGYISSAYVAGVGCECRDG